MKGNPHWAKGVSGNPGGRPKISAALKELGLDPRKVTKELIEQLLEAMRTLDKKSASWRFSIETLLHHIVGKPKETVEHLTGGDTAAQIDWSKLDQGEADALEKILEKVVESGDDDDSAVH